MIIQVTPLAAAVIIESREPRGKFWTIDESEKIIGIDNSTGEAWTEEFDAPEECLSWLSEEGHHEYRGKARKN